MFTFYTHTQSTPSMTWTVAHNLNCKPTSDAWIVRNGISQKALPEAFVHVDDNTLTIRWTQPEVGGVRLAGKVTAYVLPGTSSIDPGSPGA